MVKRNRNDKYRHAVSESDGTCFALTSGGDGCMALSCICDGCGTYACRFYKPVDRGDWVRVEEGDGVMLLPPSAYFG